MPNRIKVPVALRKAAEAWRVQKRKGQDETNAANRLRTTLKNEVEATWQTQGLPVGSKIVHDGYQYSYETTENRFIDPADLFKMYDNEEITREQLVASLKVDRKAADKEIGADIMANIEVIQPGNKLELQISELPIERVNESYIEVAEAKKPAVKRRRFGGEQKQAPVQSGSVSSKRRVRITK